MVKLLFVCLGNICRSAAAEGVARKLIDTKYVDKDIFIDSAGTYGGHSGQQADIRMRKAGEKRGYVFDSRSRKITNQDIDNFDVIVTMDENNFEDVIRLTTLENRSKVYKMASFLKMHKIGYVPDPYYEKDDGFEYVLDILEEGCDNLLEAIFASKLK